MTKWITFWVMACSGPVVAAPELNVAGNWAGAGHLPAAPENSPGYPSRAADLDALPGFRNPPPGYGEVPFWWWTGDPLDKDRLAWQIEELHKKGISGVQVNYAHEDTPGWPTYPSEPDVFSDSWWEMWKFAAGECGKRGMGIGLSGYTLDWPNGKSLVSRTIYSDPEITGRELTVVKRSGIHARKTLVLDLPKGVIGVRAYRIIDGALQPGGRIHYHFDGGVVVHSYPHPQEQVGGEGGACFVGTKGRLAVDRNALVSEPSTIVRTLLRPADERVYHSTDHADNFLECLRSRRAPICGPEEAAPSIEVLLSGGIALALKRSLRWDPAQGIFDDDEEANRLLGYRPRPPWHL